ncbi:MAG: hypothetical protein IK130_02000 [Oscillospiraceae bacterium]|nr:hypothetical protein [Oscillospiraceae bacterium]
MGANYASVSDITAIGRTLTTAQESAAGVLLTQASALLRMEAHSVGKSVDGMIADPATGADYALVVKNVVVSAVCRALDAAEESTGYESALQTVWFRLITSNNLLQLRPKSLTALLTASLHS